MLVFKPQLKNSVKSACKITEEKMKEEKNANKLNIQNDIYANIVHAHF